MDILSGINIFEAAEIPQVVLRSLFVSTGANMTIIHEIFGKVKVKWEALTRTVFDYWYAMALVNLDEYRTTVLETGLKPAVPNCSQA